VVKHTLDAEGRFALLGEDLNRSHLQHASRVQSLILSYLVDLSDEGEKLWKLTNDASTTHVTRLICKPKPYTQRTINTEGLSMSRVNSHLLDAMADYLI
jgi:hypothetical protein